MMMTIVGAVMLLIAAAETTAIPAVARRTIAETNVAWLQAMKRQDAAAIAALYGDDAVFVTPTGRRCADVRLLKRSSANGSRTPGASSKARSSMMD
jgi:hypothetical protein